MRYFDHKQMFCSNFLPLVSVADSFFFFLILFWNCYDHGERSAVMFSVHHAFCIDCWHITVQRPPPHVGVDSFPCWAYSRIHFFLTYFAAQFLPDLTGKRSIKQALGSVWQVSIILEWLFTFWHGNTQGYRLMSSWTKSQNGSQWKQFWWEPRRWDPKMLLMVLLDLRLIWTKPEEWALFHQSSVNIASPKQAFDKIWTFQDFISWQRSTAFSNRTFCMWPLNTWNAARVAEKLNSSFKLVHYNC